MKNVNEKMSALGLFGLFILSLVLAGWMIQLFLRIWEVNGLSELFTDHDYKTFYPGQLLIIPGLFGTYLAGVLVFVTMYLFVEKTAFKTRGSSFPDDSRSFVKMAVNYLLLILIFGVGFFLMVLIVYRSLITAFIVGLMTLLFAGSIIFLFHIWEIFFTKILFKLRES